MNHHLICVGYIISFLVERKKFNSLEDRGWNDLCKCQLKSGSLIDIPFFVPTSTLLNHSMPIVSDHFRSLFNRHQKNRYNQESQW